MNNKYFTIFLAITMILFLQGCGKQENNSTNQKITESNHT